MELNDFNNLDLPSQLELLPSYELRSKLSRIPNPYDFDFIGVSETKKLINKDFISNVDIEGYQMYSQPSKSAFGGVAICVNNKLDRFRKDDLSIIGDDFESLCIEIKIIKAKISCVVVFIDIQTGILNIF